MTRPTPTVLRYRPHTHSPVARLPLFELFRHLEQAHGRWLAGGELAEVTDVHMLMHHEQEVEDANANR